MNQFHGFDRVTRRYTGPYPLNTAILDPVNQTATPHNTLPFAPEREAGDNEAILVNEAYDDWEFVSKTTPAPFTVRKTASQSATTQLGALPEHLTHKEPQTPWDEWKEDQNNWQTNTQNRQKDLCHHFSTRIDQLADTVRLRFLAGGYSTEAEYKRVKQVAEEWQQTGMTGEPPRVVAAHIRRYNVVPEDAVASINAMETGFNNALDTIRDLRFDCKTALEALPETADETAFEAEFKTFHEQLDAINP